MSDYIHNNPISEQYLLMRHDIDRMPMNALNIARIENEFGIKSTYYFRKNNNVFCPEILREIEDMGHEIGYHYEVLSKTKEDYEKAIDLFEKELAEFRKICDIKTICMHGRPLSRYDNRDLWKNYDFRDFGIIGEAYLSCGNEVNYYSDTGRSWSSKNNIRDIMPGNKKTIIADTTDDIIDLIKNNKLDNIYILTHPERWSSNNFNWVISYLNDFIFNTGKKTLTMLRNLVN